MTDNFICVLCSQTLNGKGSDFQRFWRSGLFLFAEIFQGVTKTGGSEAVSESSCPLESENGAG